MNMSITGSRIRAKRLDRGIGQADLARTCGISPSYLNLIEHNRRPIGGKLLNALADALDADAKTLSEGADSALSARLGEAAGRDPGAKAETDRLDDFAGRFPGWARLVEAQEHRVRRLERMVETLGDRLTHDPLLGEAMHDVLSTVTAIRSTSAILAEGEAVNAEWQVRFHRNLFEDSQRLTEAAGALVSVLDASEADGTAAMTPQEEVEAWLAARDWQVPEFDRALSPEADRVLSADTSAPTSRAGQALALRWLTRHRTDVRVVPTAALSDALHDPAALSKSCGAPLDVVLRRLGLQRGAGLVIADGAGALTFRRPIDGFEMPRFGAACPLWPLFRAMQHPMTPIREDLVMPGDAGRRFRAYAIAVPTHPSGFEGPAVIEATMLLLPLSGGTAGQVTPVGQSCRVCPRDDCAARREPSYLGAGLTAL